MANEPQPRPVELTPEQKQRNEAFAEADADFRAEIAQQVGETPDQSIKRRLEARNSARRERQALGEKIENIARWEFPALQAKVKEQDKFIFQLADLRAEVDDIMVEQLQMQRVVEDTTITGMAVAESAKLTGTGMIRTSNGQVAWLYQKESFGWHKADSDKVWIHNGYIRDIEDYYFVDSQALTLSDTTEYVYVAQNKVSGVTSIAKMATHPDDTETEFVWPIASFVRKDVDGAGDYRWNIKKVYNTGDVYRKRLVPDGSSVYATGKLNSLELRGSSDAHKWDVQTKNWHAPSNDTIGLEDKITFWPNTGTEKPTSYAKLSTVKSYIENNLDLGDSGGGGAGDAIGDWLNDHRAIEHNSLDAITRSGAPDDFNGGGGEGCSDHDRRYWKYASAAGASESKSFATSGTLNISNATDAGAGTGAIVTAGGISVAKTVNVQDATAPSVGGGAIVTAGGASIAKGYNMTATNKHDLANFYADVTTAFNVKAPLTLFERVDASSTFAVGEVGTEFDAIGMAVSTTLNMQGANTAELNLGLGGALGFATINYNGTAGIDITGWTTKGGVTGTGVVEIDFDDFKSGDKILVRR